MVVAAHVRWWWVWGVTQAVRVGCVPSGELRPCRLRYLLRTTNDFRLKVNELSSKQTSSAHNQPLMCRETKS